MAITVDKIDNMLRRYGISAVARIYENAEFDPTKNKTDLGNYVDYDIIVVPPYTWREGFKNAVLVNSGNALSGIAAKDLLFVTKTGTILIINNIQWIVLGFTPIQNNIGILYYQLEIQSK